MTPPEPPSPEKSPSPAEAILREKLREAGSIGMEEFLAVALYDPEAGYYSGAKNRVGRAGDFFTNVSLGSIFGEVLARQLAEIWRLAGAPRPLFLIEQGANNGDLAADILNALREIDPEALDCAAYRIVEPLPKLQAVQEHKLSSHPATIEWFSSLEDLPSMAFGIHLSNELFDAFPFSLLEWNGERWEELRVAEDPAGKLHFTARPIRSHPLLDMALKLPSNLPVGYRTELRPCFRPWAACLSPKIETGVLLACDYGFLREEFRHPDRISGTLQCYHSHQKDHDPLARIGEKDISAHVDFSDLAESLTESGWEIRGFTDQYHFLVGASETWLLSLDGQLPSPQDQKKLRQLRNLLHPESMGRKFQFFCAVKNLPPDFLPSGFSKKNHPPSAKRTDGLGC